MAISIYLYVEVRNLTSTASCTTSMLDALGNGDGEGAFYGSLVPREIFADADQMLQWLSTTTFVSATVFSCALVVEHSERVQQAVCSRSRAVLSFKCASLTIMLVGTCSLAASRFIIAALPEMRNELDALPILCECADNLSVCQNPEAPAFHLFEISSRSAQAAEQFTHFVHLCNCLLDVRPQIHRVATISFAVLAVIALTCLLSSTRLTVSAKPVKVLPSPVVDGEAAAMSHVATIGFTYTGASTA